jgi:membrane-bound lytic murein transglycosylase D
LASSSRKWLLIWQLPVVLCCALSAKAQPTPVATPPGAAAPSSTAPPASPISTLRSLLNIFVPKGAGDPPADEREPTPAAIEAEAADLITPPELLTIDEIHHALPWQAPNYTGQVGALGWKEDAFEVPKGLETRVAFWRDVYTKYSSSQGILHDRDNFEIVYEPVDFIDIMKDRTKSDRQKARAREKLVDQQRKVIVERLKRLQTVTSAAGLTGEDLRTWKLFEHINDPAKFKEAAEKGRVRFQLGQRDRFMVGIYHSGRYLREMERIFREEKLPVELTRLPFVESSFNIRARSRVGASGIWQFMPRTGRLYMKVGTDVDERNDPLRATRASARLLKQNYLMLESWPLALTGYNHGANGIRRIMAKLRTTSIVDIINQYSSRSFGFASENFYACFLAALDVERNAKKYFGEVRWGPAAEGAEVKLQRPLSYQALLEFFDGDKEAADFANSHVLTRVRKGRANIPTRSFVRVPTARAKIAEDFTAGRLPPAKLHAALLAVPLTKKAPLGSPMSPALAAAVAPSATPTPSALK